MTTYSSSISTDLLSDGGRLRLLEVGAVWVADTCRWKVLYQTGVLYCAAIPKSDVFTIRLDNRGSLPEIYVENLLQLYHVYGFLLHCICVFHIEHVILLVLLVKSYNQFGYPKVKQVVPCI